MIKQILTVAMVCLATTGWADQHEQSPGSSKTMVLTFGGVEYLHRWSKDGQNVFTPRDDPDLSTWRDMITINVHEGIDDGEGLAALANRVVAAYQNHGEIVRTASKPRTDASPAEHFVAALLGAPGLLEAAFARFLIYDGVGYVVVYSRRSYGPTAANELGHWVAEHGPIIERLLRTWGSIPRRGALKSLPDDS